MALVGCGAKEETAIAPAKPVPGAPPPAANYQEAVKQIQDDPNMPEQMKSVRIEAAKQRFGPGAAGQAPASAPAPAP